MASATHNPNFLKKLQKIRNSTELLSISIANLLAEETYVRSYLFSYDLVHHIELFKPLKSYIDFLEENVPIKKKSVGRPEFPMKLACMLYYAIYIAKYSDQQIVEIGSLIRTNGEIHKNIDSYYEEEGLYNKIGVPSVDYEKNDFGEITPRWIKPFKTTRIPDLTRKYIYTHYKKNICAKHYPIPSSIINYPRYQDIPLNTINEVLSSYFKMMRLLKLKYWPGDGDLHNDYEDDEEPDELMEAYDSNR